jgi:hypothetical protein
MLCLAHSKEADMTPTIQIEIETADFDRLKALAEPFVDTPATVVRRLLDSYSAGAKLEPKPVLYRKKFSEVPPLTFSKLLDGRIGSQSPDKFTWDAMLVLALTTGKRQLNDFESLRRVSGANLVDGRKEDDGYKYLPSQSFSYQGVSAEDAMRIVNRICKSLGLAWEIEFEWRDKEGAFLPGQRAKITMVNNVISGETI